MQSYLTPEEVAETLKVEVGEIMSLIQQGKLKAIRIGSNIRISEAELEQLAVTCAAAPVEEEADSAASGDPELAAGARWCLTRTGRAKFRVSGSVAEGAKIWPGKMPYPIKLPKAFMDELLAQFHGDVPVGGKFDDPVRGSLGEFIQQKLGIKMNPAVYLAALLIDEGYAKATRRGYIRMLGRPARER